VVAAVVVVGVVAIVLVAVLGGDSKSPTEAVEEKLPAQVQDDFSSKGVQVVVSNPQCDDIPHEDGSFTASCTVDLEGSSRPLPVDVTGTIDGNDVNYSFTTDNVVTEDLAIDAAQDLVDDIDRTIKVLSCQLPETPLVVRGGDEFTCEVDSDETITVTVDSSGSPEITDVQ
jgi:hypothetical protein